MILKNDHTSGDSFPLIPGRRKEDRVYCWCHNLWGIGKNGGKFYDINFKGAPYPPNPKYPLGKICLEPTYIFWQCDALAWCYGVGEVMPMQYVWMWTENKNGTKYWINEMSKQSRLTCNLCLPGKKSSNMAGVPSETKSRSSSEDKRHPTWIS